MFGFKPGSPGPFELIRQALSSTKEGYDLIAPKFDSTPFLTKKSVLKVAVSYLREQRSYNDAIDFCTGTGAGISALLPIVQRRVVGVDWSEPMLAEARKKFEAAIFTSQFSRRPEVKLVRDNVFEVRYRNAFDLATCFGALGHIERAKQKDFVAAAHSALRPGGIFVLDSLNLSWHNSILWLLFAFDAVMRVRNLLWRPRFVMYYLHWLLPGVLRLLNKKNWSSVRVLPVEIKGRPSLFSFVIATKR
jgi:SAM-dependent methyltransferase